MMTSFGDVQSVVNWFAGSQHALLVLFVGGDLDDGESFQAIIDKRPALHTISGRGIAVMLFATTPHESQAQPIEWTGDRRTVGTLWLPDGTAYSGNELHEPVMFDDVPHGLAETELVRSQTIAHELRQQFGISAEESPCIVLLTQDDPSEPFVITTRGGFDVRVLSAFLSELNDAVQDVPALELNVATEIQSVDQHRRELGLKSQKLDELRDILARDAADVRRLFSGPEFAEVLEDLETTSKSVYDLLGLQRNKSSKALTAALVDEARSIAESPEVNEVLRRTKKTPRQIRRLESEIENHQEAVDGLTQYLFEKHQAAEMLNTSLQEVERICDRYSNRFAWQRSFRSVRKFAAALTGAASMARNLSSLSNFVATATGPSR